jgi:hypothetical protein
MSADVWVPVVSVVVGGLLTTLGSMMMHRITRRSERRDTLRGKLEELYRLSAQLPAWAEYHVELAVTMALSATRGPAFALDWLKSREKPPRPTDDLVMVARFYHPNLAANADALAVLADELIDAYNAFDSWRIGRPDQASEVDPVMLNPITAVRDRIGESVNTFQQALAREAGRYV